MKRLFGRIIVTFVICLISFIAYSSQIFIIWPWYGSEVSVELLCLLVPFNVLVGMLFWSYYLCVRTDPGRVPPSWAPDTKSADGYEAKKLTGSPRFCRTCEQYKPPRSHHCRQCGHCVLRMDHHCPWVNNCIGHFNYGHFIRFLFYVDLACSYHLTMITRRVLSTMSQRYWDEPTGTELVFIILNYTLCIPVILAVGAFSIYHLLSLMGNTTTIEGWEKDKVATLVRRNKIKDIKFPYNLGRRRNIESMLGTRPLFWCWPTRTPGTGLRYPLASFEDEPASSLWPPTDPVAQEYLDQDEAHDFELAESPWTFENGSLNPNLETGNARLRSSASKRRRSRPLGVSALPPYHPDYNSSTVAENDDAISVSSQISSDAEYYIEQRSQPRVRRGSEGFEVAPVDREKTLRRYVESLAQEDGRYNVYIPQPHSEEDESEDEDDVPLGERIEEWRTAAATL